MKKEETGPILLLKSLWQPPLQVALLESSIKRDLSHSVKFETLTAKWSSSYFK